MGNSRRVKRRRLALFIAGSDWPLRIAVVAFVLTVGALGVGVWRLLCEQQMEAANWVMAAGGLGLIVFSAVQLHREAQREEARLTAARAKLKPAAWLARRMCDQSVIESNEQSMKLWLARWYSSQKARLMETGGIPTRIDILEALMRETVTLAAEAAAQDIDDADAAFSSFIVAANLLNDLNARVSGAGETTVYQE